MQFSIDIQFIVLILGTTLNKSARFPAIWAHFAGALKILNKTRNFPQKRAHSGFRTVQMGRTFNRLVRPLYLCILAFQQK